ncbi:hypothetical protein [Adhaeribacter rhizoryzae]|uniref:Uncharacterized protein n=1 Tax=Adhaeribacter rhizoryzae TaxID=2607907 RepID=A0A5M6D5F2_9BACT|nr:hypothetical protein [Adhaeribacter rhizoryzae]KAA5541976.1 hypothetical protein F0145_19510 [Adhaeribacter rhizoryzae]
MATDTISLKKALNTIVQGLENPNNHYMIGATYFEHISPENLGLDKHYMAVVYLHQEATWNVELSENNLVFEVLLNRDNPDRKYRIRIPLSEIWSIQESSGTTFTDTDRLFYNADVFKKMLTPK